MSRTHYKFRAGSSFAFLTGQMQGVHKDLLSFEAGTEECFKTVSDSFGRLESKVDALDRKMDLKIDGLADTLPGIVGDALREVLRAQSK